MKAMFIGGSQHGQLRDIENPRYQMQVMLAGPVPRYCELIRQVPVPKRPRGWQRLLAKVAGVPSVVDVLFDPPAIVTETYNLNWYSTGMNDQLAVYVLDGLKSAVPLDEEVWSMAHYLNLPAPIHQEF